MKQTSAKPPGCFWAFFLLIGLMVAAVFGYTMVWLPVRVNLFYVETTCIVLDKRLEQVGGGKNGPTFRPLIHIEYTVANQVHRAWTYDASSMSDNLRARQQAILDRFQQGQQYPCWFDPGNPDKAVLTREFSLWGLMIVIPLIFVAIGAGGLIYNRKSTDQSPPVPFIPGLTAVDKKAALGAVAFFVGGFIAAGAVAMILVFTLGPKVPFWCVPFLFLFPFVVYVSVIRRYGRRALDQLKLSVPSRERVAAAVLLAEKGALPADEASQKPDDDRLAPITNENHWPTIPELKRIEPGLELAFHIPSDDSPGGMLVAAFLFAIFWNGVVSIFLFQVIDGHRKGNPDWFQTVFLIPFVVIGLGALGFVLFSLVRFIATVMAGTVQFEVSNHPLTPGDSCQFLIEQSGLFSITDMQLKLKCIESATYSAGTSTSTDTREVFQQSIEDVESTETSGVRGHLTVPREAMHSFEADHNKITWKLHVNGKVAGFLPYRNEFPVIVYPAGDLDG